jgi:release factor glutamine methyltransferase
VTSPAGATVGDLLDESIRTLAAAGIPDARREAIAVLAAALATDRGGVLAHRPDEVPEAQAAKARSWIASRARRVPLQHLTGVVEFRGLTLEVGPDVLIPRPETEGLVEAVLAAGLPDEARVADLGTGSGAIAVTLSVARPSWRVAALDRSARALAVARRNAARHVVGERIEFVEGDFTVAAPLAPFDAVVSNPPYVTEDEWRGLEPEVRDHEPKEALVPGPSGVEAYEVIVALAASALRPDGLLALELGHESAPAVTALASSAGLRDVRVLPDLAGIPRILLARR